MTPVLAVLSAALGLVIGSFLNVVVYRVPAGLSVVAPASACPRCHHPIRGRDNIPLLSWLALAGRCRDCRTPISARYPLVELGTCLFFVGVTVWFGRAITAVRTPADSAHAVIVLVAALYLAAITVALALIDVDEHRLPNAIVLPAYPVLLTLLAGASAVSGDWEALLRGVIGLVVLGAFYLVLALAVPRGMGLGDVKLAGVLGLFLAYLGWGPLAVGAFGAFLLGGTFATALLLTGRTRRGSGIPFGPWMLGGAWIGVVLGTPVLDGYLHIIGLL